MVETITRAESSPSENLHQGSTEATIEAILADGPADRNTIATLAGITANHAWRVLESMIRKALVVKVPLIPKRPRRGRLKQLYALSKWR
jgi:hypothetical protein